MAIVSPCQAIVIGPISIVGSIPIVITAGAATSRGLIRAARRLRQTDHPGDALADRPRIVLALNKGRELFPTRLGRVRVLEPDSLPDRRDQRPIGDPLAVGQAGPTRDQRLVGHVAKKLTSEPRLAHAGRAENREQLAGAVAHGLLEGVVQTTPLALATDHRRVEPDRVASGNVADLDEAVGRERRDLCRFHEERVPLSYGELPGPARPAPQPEIALAA
jgi:hypothetical protein